MRGRQWFGALSERNFRLFFVGKLTSDIGSGMLPVALSFAVLGRGGSVGDVGFVLGAETLPLVLFLLVAGVIADRTSRRVVMLSADVGRAAARPAVAGVVVALSGPGWAAAVDGATYEGSAACLSMLRVRPADREKSVETFVHQLQTGWRASRERTWLWVVVSQFSINGLVAFPAFFVLGAVIAHRSLGGAVAWGSILAAQGAGSVVAGLALLREHVRRPLLVAVLALVAWPVTLAVLTMRAHAIVIGVFAFFSGAALGIFGPLWDTTMQREVPAEVLSRASAYDWFGSFVFLPLGYAIEGVVVHLLGITGTLWLGASTMAAGLLVVLMVPSVTGLRAPPTATGPGGRGPESLTSGS